MRKVIDLRRPLGSVPIEDIKLNAKCRDDVPAILIGLQAIYKDKATREELFRLLDAHVLPDRRRDTGRPGMDFWSIVVMGVLKQGLNCDYDRLQDLANEHGSIRKMLGHADFDDSTYELQTIRDNVELMTPELLRDVSRRWLPQRATRSWEKSLAQRWSGAVTRSWRRRTSTIRPTSTCFWTRRSA